MSDWNGPQGGWGGQPAPGQGAPGGPPQGASWPGQQPGPGYGSQPGYGAQPGPGTHPGHGFNPGDGVHPGYGLASTYPGQPGYPVAPHQGGARPLSSVGRLVMAAILDSVLSMLTLGIGWIIWAAVTAGEAQTPGKKIMGMQVVDATTGQPLTWGSYVFLRGLVGGIVNNIAISITIGVLFFMPLWDDRNQSVAAKVSNSVVVDV